METYGAILFQNDKPSSELEKHLREMLESEYEVSVEEFENKNGFTVISVMGGSATEYGIEGIIAEIADKGFSVIRAYMLGDEDPWCRLYAVEGEELVSFECDPSIYEHLSCCDEEQINESEELKEAHSKGPEKFFGDRFDWWKQGLENLNLPPISSEIESIIEYANYAVD